MFFTKTTQGAGSVLALHHNKIKRNYHIHLIFSERRLLPEPETRIATRSVFYDETGKRENAAGDPCGAYMER